LLSSQNINLLEKQKVMIINATQKCKHMLKYNNQRSISQHVREVRLLSLFIENLKRTCFFNFYYASTMRAAFEAQTYFNINLINKRHKSTEELINSVSAAVHGLIRGSYTLHASLLGSLIQVCLDKSSKILH